MCTVTFVPTPEGFILTSNRDENKFRPTLPPRTVKSGNQTLIYPKDEEAGGTWFAHSSAGRVACLLNGGFTKHKHVPPYSRSRGLVLLESLQSATISIFLSKVDLKGVEPFTLLLIDYECERSVNITELVWDEHKKHIQTVGSDRPSIWSSATLYEEPIRKLRKEIFSSWIKNTDSPKPEALFGFHNSRHGLDDDQDIVMKKNDFLMTVSVSQIAKEGDQIQFRYTDLIKNEKFCTDLRCKATV